MSIYDNVESFGFPYDKSWLEFAVPGEIQKVVEEFDTNAARSKALSPKNQLQDLEKVLQNPYLQNAYSFLICESAGVNIARKTAAAIFARFVQIRSQQIQKRLPTSEVIAPARWMVIDGTQDNPIPLNCGALFIDAFAYNSTSMKADRIRDILARSVRQRPTFLIASGADPFKMIQDRLNVSFDGYLFLGTTLVRTL